MLTCDLGRVGLACFGQGRDPSVLGAEVGGWGPVDVKVGV